MVATEITDEMVEAAKLVIFARLRCFVYDATDVAREALTAALAARPASAGVGDKTSDLVKRLTVCYRCREFPSWGDIQEAAETISALSARAGSKPQEG